MKTIAMIFRNLFSRSLTVRYPDAPEPHAGYRGLIVYEAAKCTGCSMCAFCCTSHAIRFRGTKTDVKWSYDAAQCTYCGRCVDGCEAGALTQLSECPPPYVEAGALKCAYVTPRALLSTPGAPPQPSNASGGAQ